MFGLTAVEESSLLTSGWTVLDTSESLVTVAARFGKPVPSRLDSALVDILTPTPSTAAPRRSLSAIYGTGAFPYHVDGAYFPDSPHFVLLRAEAAEGYRRPTLLIDTRTLFSTAERSVLIHGVWRVAARRSFLTSVMSPEGSAAFKFRFDRDCMTPLTRSAICADELIVRRVSDAIPTAVDWTPGKTIVIDNWRILHGRGPGSAEPEHRILSRVMVASREA